MKRKTHEIKNETSTFEHPVRHAPYTGSDLSRRSLTRNPNLREGLMNSSGGLGDYYFNGTAAGAANTSGAADGISNLWPQSVRTEFKFLELLQLYYTPLLVGLGSIGNILSVFVFFGTKLRKLSSSYYLSALASSDTGFLVTLFGVWLNLIDVPWFNKDGFCQISIYLTMEEEEDEEEKEEEEEEEEEKEEEEEYVD
ncbi:hypothetical protein M8J77_009567 [Diaphorina citri]|nr:hypothetical protein M8J77_009567 [Diaphorina citri]